ncbi:MAG: queuosine precursor transporter, partial [Simkaniaceae bacterium]|nr:queuosine precursor transporter [Simkaniaceae bacterium]
MNALIFFSHIFIVVAFIFCALKLGKEALITSFILQAILGNLFVTKQMELCSFTITCSDVYTIGAFLSFGLLQEYFGIAITKKTLWHTLFFLAFFCVMSEMHLLYIASPFDTTQNAFEKLLSIAPRIITASTICILISQKLNLTILSFLQKIHFGSIAMRIGCATTLSQLIDTLLFSFLGLYGLVHNMLHIITISFAVKLV